MKASEARSALGLVALALLGAFAVQAVPLKEKANSKADFISYRLPNNTRPVTYDIHLTTGVDKGDFTFTGQVLIVLQVFEPTSDITIHARQLTINSINLTSAYLSPEVFPVTYAYDSDTEFLKIISEAPLPRDYYRLYIEYSGELRTDNAGFYLSTYVDDNGNTVNLATTQFESTDARHAFPCYDEPAKKAIFKLSITHGSSYTAVSNMPVIDGPNDNGDGTSTTTFRQTTLMSTYLLAFIVSDFKSTELTGRVPHRVFSRDSTQDTQKFALETSVKTLEAIEDYLNVSYKLPKMDNAAIPDFAAGAMENWGLVTYREEYLLYSQEQSTTATQNSIATVIAHEFGHQWFGNLVSPLWWTYTWLNEGFASILTYIGGDAVFPEWDLWQDFLVSDFQRALLADGKVDPRPMTHYIEAPSAISGVFDSVVYSKAASVLIMLRNAFTDNTFKKALTDYLIKMEYESAEEDDLFESFEKAVLEDNIFGSTSNIDLFTKLKSWTNQGGYPLITVTRDYNKGTFVIRQEPFDGTSAAPSTDKRSWWVPFNFATAKDPHYKVTEMYGYLNVGESSKEISQTTGNQWESSDWIVLNKRSTGYYRVNYDVDNWKLLTLALTTNLDQFHVNNRAQLLDDAFRLVLAKILQFETFLDLSVYLQKESDYAPWMTANSYLTIINRYLNGDSEYDLFQFYVGKIVENFYHEVGVSENSDDEHLRKMGRSTAINWACRADHGDCLEVTNNRLRDYILTGKTIEPNLRTSIICNGLTKAGETEFTYILKEVMDSKDQAFRRQMMSSVLGCVQDISLIEQYLETSIKSDDTVNYRVQERTYVIPGVVDKGPIQLAAAIDFLIENHAKYNELSSGWTNVNPLLSVIRTIASVIVSEAQQTHFEKLLAKLTDYNDIEQSDFDAVRATVNANLDWIKSHRDELITWLKNFKNTNGGEGEGSGDEGDGAATIVASTVALTVATFVSIRSLL